MVNTSVVQYDTRKIFQPYFRQRWQNMQNIICDSEILKYIPPAYKTYFIAYVQQWEQWSQGFVPMLHQRDFFATGIGMSLVDLLVRETMSGGYRLDSKDQATQKGAENWAKRMHLNSLFSRMFTHSNAVGNAFLKLTPKGLEVYPTVYSSTRAFISANKHNEITGAIFLDRLEADTVSEKSQEVREYRFMLDGVPYFMVEVGEYRTPVTTPTWNFKTRLNKRESAKFQATYGDIKPRKWYRLPFDDLGVYNVPNKAVAVAMADIPCYSDSSLHTALDILYSIDFNYSAQQLDMYYGKTRVLVPKEMQPRYVNSANVFNVVNGMTYREAVASAPLSDDYFTKLETPNEEQSPYFIQPDLRGETHKYIRDADLELLAMKIGVSSTTLANHLSYNGAKTATQVDSEDDTTQKTINNKRELANGGINDMLRTVARYYGWADELTITWNRSSSNSKQENDQLLAEYNSGLLPLREYLKKRWRDLTEQDIERWVAEINEQNQAKAFMSQPFMDGFGEDIE